MAFLGTRTNPNSGYWFDYTTNKQFWNTSSYNLSGGGVVTDMWVYMAGYGGSATCRLVIWNAGGSVAWQSGNFSVGAGSVSPGGQAWQHRSVPNKYLPAGNYQLGFWTSGSVIWTFESSGGVTGRSGLGAPGNASGGADEYAGAGYGNLGAYIQYSPGGIHDNIGTPAAPNFTSATLQINVGTPAAPNWQPLTLYANIGTPAAPNWVPAT